MNEKINLNEPIRNPEGEREIIDRLLSKLPVKYFDNGVDQVVLIPVENPDGSVTEFAGIPQGTYPPHVHEGVDSEITILVGSGVFILGEKKISYGPGSTFSVPRGTKHGLDPADEDTWMLTRLSSHIFNPETKESDFKYQE